MNVAISDVTERIDEEVRAPKDTVLRALIDVIRDFCYRTRCWKHEVSGESIYLGVSDYEVEMPTNDAELLAVEKLEVAEQAAEFKTMAWLDANVSNWRYRAADDFRYFTHVQPQVITFPCVPTKNSDAGVLAYRIACRPKLTAEELPEELNNEWNEVWACGAKARLMAQSGKPWANLQRSQYLERYYMSERGLARIRVSRSFGEAAEQWVNPRGFA
jgi:hypothetical protein